MFFIFESPTTPASRHARSLLSKCFLIKYNRIPLHESKLELERLPMTMKQNTQRQYIIYNIWWLRAQFPELAFPGSQLPPLPFVG